MHSYRIVFIVATVALFSTLAGAQQRGPSTQEERVRAVQTAKSLQSDPLAPNVQQDREWLVKWLIEVPDISVKMCTTFLGDLGDSKSGNPGAIIATMLASQAVFVIDHPDKAKDVDAIYFAGVDGALHGYEAIRLKDASYRLPHLDDLSFAKMQNGWDCAWALALCRSLTSKNVSRVRETARFARRKTRNSLRSVWFRDVFYAARS